MFIKHNRIILRSVTAFGPKAAFLASSVLGKAFTALKAFFATKYGDWLKGGITIKVTFTIAKLVIQTLKNILDLLEHLEGFWKQVRGFVISVGILDNLNVLLMVTFLNAKGNPISKLTLTSQIGLFLELW